MNKYFYKEMYNIKSWNKKYQIKHQASDLKIIHFTFYRMFGSITCEEILVFIRS